MWWSRVIHVRRVLWYTKKNGTQVKWMNQEQKAFFDERAAGWDEHVHHDEGRIRAILAHVPVHGLPVLDVGCGTGVLVPHLRRMGASLVVESDVSPNMLAVNRAKHGDEGVRYACGDALTHEGGPYGAVLMYSMFPHFEDQRAALRRLRRLVAPGGCLLIAHGQGRAAINAMHREADEAVCRDRLPPMAELHSWLRAAGYGVGWWRDDEDIFAVVAR